MSHVLLFCLHVIAMQRNKTATSLWFHNIIKMFQVRQRTWKQKGIEKRIIAYKNLNKIKQMRRIWVFIIFGPKLGNRFELQQSWYPIFHRNRTVWQRSEKLINWIIWHLSGFSKYLRFPCRVWHWFLWTKLSVRM